MYGIHIDCPREKLLIQCSWLPADAPHKPHRASQSFYFFQKVSNGKESSLQFPVLLQKWEMDTYIPLLSPDIKAFLPHDHVVSGNQRSGAAWLSGCHSLGSDKHNRSSGLNITHAHPCSCPSLGCWNSPANGMQGYFRLSYATLHELVYTPLFPLELDLLALCTWGVFVSFISAWQS